jgi:hypothetical protein
LVLQPRSWEKRAWTWIWLSTSPISLVAADVDGLCPYLYTSGQGRSPPPRLRKEMAQAASCLLTPAEPRDPTGWWVSELAKLLFLGLYPCLRPLDYIPLRVEAGDGPKSGHGPCIATPASVFLPSA